MSKKEPTQEEIIKKLKSDTTKLASRGKEEKTEFNLTNEGESKVGDTRKRKGSKDSEDKGEGEDDEGKGKMQTPQDLKTLKDFINAMKNIEEGEDFAIDVGNGKPISPEAFRVASVYRSTEIKDIQGVPNTVDYLNSDNDQLPQSETCKDKQDKKYSFAYPHLDIKGSETQPSPIAQIAKFKKSEEKEKKNPNDIVKVGSVFTFQYILDLLKSCVEMNEPALLIGETGVGKTHIIRELAQEHGKSLIRVSLNGSTSVEEILGKWLAVKGTTVWQDGILLSAMKAGHWIVFDEINAALPEILFTLHSLLDDDRKVTLPEKDNEVIRPHKDFRFFSTMNPSEDYAGTKDLNKALVSRFTAVLNIEPLAELHEISVLTDNYNVPDEAALRLVSIATYLRKAKKEEKIFYFCSTRDIVQAGKLIVGGVNIELAITGSILNKMSKDERDEVGKQVGGFVKDTSLEGVDVKGVMSKNKELTQKLTEKDRNYAILEKSLDKLLREMSSQIIAETTKELK